MLPTVGSKKLPMAMAENSKSSIISSKAQILKLTLTGLDATAILQSPAKQCHTEILRVIIEK